MTDKSIIRQIFSVEEIESIIGAVPDVVASLHDRVVLSDYCRKIAESADNFVLFHAGDLKAFVSIYANDKRDLIAFITQIACMRGERNKGYGSQLLEFISVHAAEKGMKKLRLEVAIDNTSARKFYLKHGFTEIERTDQGIFMEKHL